MTMGDGIIEFKGDEKTQRIPRLLEFMTLLKIKGIKRRESYTSSTGISEYLLSIVDHKGILIIDFSPNILILHSIKDIGESVKECWEFCCEPNFIIKIEGVIVVETDRIFNEKINYGKGLSDFL
jgi:uncharacterized Fe-S cluster-containing radical SAM superfamily protein